MHMGFGRRWFGWFRGISFSFSLLCDPCAPNCLLTAAAKHDYCEHLAAYFEKKASAINRTNIVNHEEHSNKNNIRRKNSFRNGMVAHLVHCRLDGKGGVELSDVNRPEYDEIQTRLAFWSQEYRLALTCAQYNGTTSNPVWITFSDHFTFQNFSHSPHTMKFYLMRIVGIAIFWKWFNSGEKKTQNLSMGSAHTQCHLLKYN